MYTTLNSQKNLMRVYADKKLFFKVILSWISPYIKFYIMTRNPFNRIESFYRDKFLNAEKFSLWMIQNDKSKWQKSAELFSPYLDLNMQMAPLVVSKKLMLTKFEEVISILPYVFMKDRHMRPQYHARKITNSKFGIRFTMPIRIVRFFRIESEEDLKEFSEIFNIDLSIKKNNTKDNRREIIWDTHSIKIIEKLYEKDFKYFDYEKKSKLV